jgi:hypothetical protein
MQPTQLLLFGVIVTRIADFSRMAAQISPEKRSTFLRCADSPTAGFQRSVAASSLIRGTSTI